MTALNKQALRQTAEKAQEHGAFNMDIHSQTVLDLLDENYRLTAERDALRESIGGDNTRAAADIYFQLVEECEIPPGGSLVGYVDDIKERLSNAEKRIAELRDWNAGLAQQSFTYQQRVAELLSENAGLKNSVENAAGCINAAYAEGLIDVLSESSDERLVDLVKRRLLFSYLPVETPATNEEIIAMGDWVLREQLEDGTRAIKTLNRRIAELEARTVAVKQFDDFQIVHYGGSEDYAKGYIDCQNNYNKALTATGIGVKGE